MTYVATATAVSVLGGVPVFADIAPDTHTIDPSSAEAAISEKTKAIIAVHLGGHQADMDRLGRVAAGPISTAEADAMEALAEYPIRLGQLTNQFSRGFRETEAKLAGIIDHNPRGGHAESRTWGEVILAGPQIGVSNPMFKQPSQGAGEVLGLNLATLAVDAIPETSFLYSASSQRVADVIDRWTTPGSPDSRGKAFTEFYRIAWREFIALDTERALYSALLPPGPAHVNSIFSSPMRGPLDVALTVGFWSALPTDYLLRITGTRHLQPGAVRRLPVPVPEHPLASALLLRALRLNCLTQAYADLWNELFDPTWSTHETWACGWPELQPLDAVTPTWTSATPLRSERSRRAALVELDALVAVWLGVSADALIAMYKARFPVLQDFESVIWFDSNERKIAGNRYTFGHGQNKEHYEQLQAHLAAPSTAPPPAGYVPPFYKVNREAEMREAHAHFQKQLDDSVTRGEWDPVKQEVPKS